MYTEKDIQRLLRRFFINYRYRLINTFVFNWESDFFCVSKSHYITECEIKISKSDFKKDFEKDKHKLLKNSMRGVWQERDPTERTAGDWHCHYRLGRETVYAPFCRMKWHNPETYNIPNRFYYVAPEGIIDPSEVPSYAGLLVIKNENITQAKGAPFLHKRQLALETKTMQTLLDKFWYLSQNQRYHLEVNNIKFKDCYENK